MRFVKSLVQALGGFGLGAMLAAIVSFGGGVPLIPSTAPFNEPSQEVATLNTFIQTLNGFTTGIGPSQIISFGQFCSVSGTATTQVCNGQRGTVTFTNQGTITAGSVAALTITNSAVANAQSVCRANVISQTVAGSSGLTVPIVTSSAGSLAVSVQNPTATATGAAGAWTLAFDCLQ